MLERKCGPRGLRRWTAGLLTGVWILAGCASSDGGSTGDEVERPRIVVTHAILGAVVTEIAGSDAEVVVLIPNGVDPHVYEPSAKDIERLTTADLVVVNGSGLEASLADGLEEVKAKRIPIFTATDHLDHVEDTSTTASGETTDSTVDSDHEHGDEDPHFWTDPRLMAEVVERLSDAIFDLGIPVGDDAMMFHERLLTLDNRLQKLVQFVPENRRILVTGHESLGYLARRYGFRIVGTVIPGLSTRAEVSAGELAALKRVIAAEGVDVVFTELGTPTDTLETLAEELGIDIVEISTHLLEAPNETGVFSGSSYEAFIEELVTTIVTAVSAESGS